MEPDIRSNIQNVFLWLNMLSAEFGQLWLVVAITRYSSKQRAARIDEKFTLKLFHIDANVIAYYIRQIVEYGFCR